MFDLTYFVAALIILLVVTVVSVLVWVWDKYIKPRLSKVGIDVNDLRQMAEIFVNAAEAMYGRYNGEKKFQQVLDWLAEYGFKVDTTLVAAAVKAAWKKLDLSQIMAGEKEATVQKPPEED